MLYGEHLAHISPEINSIIPTFIIILLKFFYFLHYWSTLCFNNDSLVTQVKHFRCFRITMTWDMYSKHQLQHSLSVSLLFVKSVFHFDHCHPGQGCLLPTEQSPNSSACHIRSFIILSLSKLSSIIYYFHNVQCP